jgi:hypothetical protein
MKSLRTLRSATAAHSKAVRRFDRINRSLPRDGGAWDWPTLAICRPDDYRALSAALADIRTALAWVRFYSVVVTPAMEHAA